MGKDPWSMFWTAAAKAAAKETDRIMTNPIKLYACLVQSVTDNGDGTHRIVVERPLMGANTPVPFEFNYPSELISDRIAPGRTINVDLDELARKVPRGWVWDKARRVYHYAVGDSSFCNADTSAMPIEYAGISDQGLRCVPCIESELFKLVGVKP